MMIDRGRRAGAVLLLLLACTAMAEEGGEPQFSEAEIILWMTDQLASIKQPMTMRYRFEKSGSLEPGFTDDVRFKVEEIKDDGSKAASLEFFSGERRVPVPSSENTDVNPVIKVYLQGDVYEMNRLTDQDGVARERWRYFQRRIKLALAETAVVKPVTITFGDRQWSAREVHFQPFVDDPHRGEFETYAGKVYSIVVADELPGYLYRIQTTVPGAEPDSPPLVQETLELVAVE